MRHFANFNAPASLAEKEGREVCGFHFADFAYDRATGLGRGFTSKSLGTQTQSGKDAQWLMKNDPEGYKQYQEQAKVKADKLRANVGQNDANALKTPHQINKDINQTVTKTLANNSPVSNVKGFLGKAKNTARRYGAKAAGLGGGLMTAAYVLPMLGGLMPAKKQQEEEQD